jgi:site-specific recombinase XerD
LVYKRSQSASSLYYKTLKAAFNKASEWGYITSNPFLSVKLPKVKTKFPVFVNELELNSILIHVRENYLKSFYIVAFNTGLRAGEICSLKWDNINLSLRIITVKNTDTFTTKSKRERIIPINEVVFKELLKLKPKILNISKNDENGFVFYKQKGVQLLVDFVSKKFKRACRLAKVNEGLHLHSLRHGFASQLVKKGVSLYVVKELLGHSNLKTTEIYSHLENEDLFKAVNLI